MSARTIKGEFRRRKHQCSFASLVKSRFLLLSLLLAALLALESSAMASVPPGDINTQPNSKVVFNAPYDDKHTYHIKVLPFSFTSISAH
jgi:hypothetical protein